MNLKDIFNLNGNEGKVLTAFMNKQKLTISEITSLTGISRPNCYDVLNRLLQKGLITKSIVNNKTQFNVTKVDYKSILDEKERELNSLQEEIEEYNNRINKLENESEEYQVEIYEGLKGLSQMLKSATNTKQITTFGAEAVLEEKYPSLWNSWLRKIKEKNTKMKVIYNERNRGLRLKNKIPIMHARFIERDFSSNTTTQIMDDRVNIYHWQKIPLVIVIRNKSIAQAYREEFNLLWKEAKD